MYHAVTQGLRPSAQGPPPCTTAATKSFIVGGGGSGSTWGHTILTLRVRPADVRSHDEGLIASIRCSRILFRKVGPSLHILLVLLRLVHFSKLYLAPANPQNVDSEQRKNGRMSSRSCTWLRTTSLAFQGEVNSFTSKWTAIFNPQ